MVNFREVVRWNKGRSVFWQVLLVLLALLYVAGLHWSNDGLWYQGDSPRHAANGLFWWDFLASFPVDPMKFALSYYARYPVIHPTGYPPLFYLIEGAAFRVFGATPFVAKGLVLAFTLLAGLYVMAWFRRWISEEAGWWGALLVLQPSVIRWTNAIMLNIPSMALAIAALYHARRWVESPTSKHLYLTTLFLLLGIYTYLVSGILVFVVIAWIILERKWEILWNRRVLILASLSALILLPWVLVVVWWEPMRILAVTPANKSALLLNPNKWIFYLKHMTDLCTPLLLGMAAIGVVAGIRIPRWRQEIRFTVTWFIVCYLGLSYIFVKEPRYGLLLVPPVVFISFISLLALLRRDTKGNPGGYGRFLGTTMGIVLAFHVLITPSVRVSRAQGFQEVVAFFEEVAPDEAIFYDGQYSGVFSFYMRLRDQDFRRGIVLAHKLLYPSSIMPRFNLIERVSSPTQVVEVLRKEGGCRWLAIEDQGASDQIPAARYLRQALAGPEFKLVKSFPIKALHATRIDVYQFLSPIEKSGEFELHFPGLGERGIFRAKPIERRSKGSE